MRPTIKSYLAGRGARAHVRKAGLLVALLLLAPFTDAQALELGRSVVMRAAAVAETEQGFVGSTATITITSAVNGSGHVFLDTFPLTEVDMQGSARLAARVAAQVAGKDVHAHDFFFVVRSGSEQIGGPSAGATMTVGAIASLNDWNVRDDVLMTGTVSPDGTVGPVGGIPQKAAAAADVGVTRFLFPAGQDTAPLGERIVNVSRYCAEELRIECVPVVDVIDAVALMTDHAIDRPPVPENVTGEDFRERLGPLSEELVANAAALVDDARASVAVMSAGSARTDLQERIDAASAKVESARSETRNGTYYTAASTSFQASIEARYVREAAQYISAQDLAAAHAESLAEARDLVLRVGVAVGSARVEDTNSFEAVAAAQVRLLEAEDRLEAAQALAAQPRQPRDILDSLHQAAFAAERAETADWWLQLSEGFARGEPVELDALEEIARDTLTTSREEVAYADAVFRAAGATGALDASRDLLERAEEAMTRGMFAGAMLDALEASVRASVQLEMAGFGGIIPASKFESARLVAARAIQGARQRGAESILAQSSYEFGLSLPDAEEKLNFLGVARVTGNLAGLPGLFGGTLPTQSRFQGEPPAYRVEVVYVAAAFAVGIALGVGAGLTALIPRKDE